MTSAFIIDINSQLQPDPNEETAALLRVLIYKVDNTTFGNDIPSIPRWTGPPHMIVQVQAILFASLAASLFSAFLAMLGKQWLNQYASVDLRGSAIERSMNRQRKLDGVVSWYFNHVLESLPLMLQAALLLLGIALSRYLWEINMAIALVVLSFTASGILFLFFIVVAGAAYVSCPYQTPGAQILRQVPGALYSILGAFRRVPRLLLPSSSSPDILLHGLHTLPSEGVHLPFVGALHILEILRTHFRASICCEILSNALYALRHEPHKAPIALLLLLLLPIWLIMDVCKAIIWLLAIHFGRLDQILGERLQQQIGLLHLHCVLWTLQTSLDGPTLL